MIRCSALLHTRPNGDVSRTLAVLLAHTEADATQKAVEICSMVLSKAQADLARCWVVS